MYNLISGLFNNVIAYILILDRVYMEWGTPV